MADVSLDENDAIEEEATSPPAPAPPAAAGESREGAAPGPGPVGGRDAGRRDRPERPRGGGGGGGGRRYFGRRKVCSFCVEHATSVDYKDPGKLRRFVSDRGRIETRRKTGTCAKHQRWLAVALKRARHLALLPYTPEHIRTAGVFTTRR